MIIFNFESENGPQKTDDGIDEEFVKNFLLNKSSKIPAETVLIESAVVELTKTLKAKKTYCFKTMEDSYGWCPTCKVYFILVLKDVCFLSK